MTFDFGRFLSGVGGGLTTLAELRRAQADAQQRDYEREQERLYREQQDREERATRAEQSRLNNLREDRYQTQENRMAAVAERQAVDQALKRAAGPLDIGWGTQGPQAMRQALFAAQGNPAPNAQVNFMDLGQTALQGSRVAGQSGGQTISDILQAATQVQRKPGGIHQLPHGAVMEDREQYYNPNPTPNQGIDAERQRVEDFYRAIEGEAAFLAQSYPKTDTNRLVEGLQLRHPHAPSPSLESQHLVRLRGIAARAKGGPPDTTPAGRPAPTTSTRMPIAIGAAEFAHRKAAGEAVIWADGSPKYVVQGP